MKHLSQVVAILVAASASLASTPAHALNQISWVASNGLDGNSCTRDLPCASFQTAHTNTNSGGYIHCVDSGYYGVISPTKSITVDCKGTTASADSVTVTASGLTIVVRGIIFDRASGGSAIFTTFPGTIVIEDCSATSYSVATSTAGNAVYAKPAGAGTTKITINNFVAANMASNGMFIDSTASSSPIHVSVSNSVFASNAGSGIATNTSAAAEIRLMLDGVKISGNGIGVNSNGPLSAVIVGGSTVTENQVGFATGGGGHIYSYGTNQINGNNNDNVGVSTLISQN